MAVQIFTQLGGIKIICQNLVRLNKILINMQPGLVRAFEATYCPNILK